MTCAALRFFKERRIDIHFVDIRRKPMAAGELRRVRDLGARLAEAGRMGFRAALVPAESPRTAGQSRVLDGLRVIDVDHIGQALGLLDLVRGQEERWA